MHNTESFGDLVRNKRTELGLTQEQLIDAMQRNGIACSQPFLSQIETGKVDANRVGVRLYSGLCSTLALDPASLSRRGYVPIRGSDDP